MISLKFTAIRALHDWLPLTRLFGLRVGRCLAPFEEILGPMSLRGAGGEPQSGYFALLPHHADLWEAPWPGILSYEYLDVAMDSCSGRTDFCFKRGSQ